MFRECSLPALSVFASFASVAVSHLREATSSRTITKVTATSVSSEILRGHRAFLHMRDTLRKLRRERNFAYVVRGPH